MNLNYNPCKIKFSSSSSSGTVFTGEIELSALTSKPHPFPQKFHSNRS